VTTAAASKALCLVFCCCALVPPGVCTSACVEGRKLGRGRPRFSTASGTVERVERDSQLFDLVYGGFLRCYPNAKNSQKKDDVTTMLSLGLKMQFEHCPKGVNEIRTPFTKKNCMFGSFKKS
jgi:hypothetical protein